jgi:hypothetical protein
MEQSYLLDETQPLSISQPAVHCVPPSPCVGVRPDSSPSSSIMLDSSSQEKSEGRISFRGFFDRRQRESATVASGEHALPKLEVGPRPEESRKWGAGEEKVPSGARAGVRSLKWGTGSENLGSRWDGAERARAQRGDRGRLKTWKWGLGRKKV